MAFYTVVIGDKTPEIELHLCKEYLNLNKMGVAILNKSFIVKDLPKFSYAKIDMLKENVVIIDRCRKRVDTVINMILHKMQRGLFVITDPLNAQIHDEIAGNNNENIDIVIYKESINDITKAETDRITNIRLHYDKYFDFSMNNYKEQLSIFGKNQLLGIWLSQAYVNYQVELRMDYVNELKESLGEMFEVRANHEQIAIELSYYLYYDMLQNTIIEITNIDTFTEVAEKLLNDLGIKLTKKGKEDIINYYIKGVPLKKASDPDE